MKFIPIVAAASLMIAQPVHAQQIGELDAYVMGQITQTCRIHKMGYLTTGEMGTVFKRTWDEYLKTNPHPVMQTNLHINIFNIPFMDQNHFCKVHWALVHDNPYD